MFYFVTMQRILLRNTVIVLPLLAAVVGFVLRVNAAQRDIHTVYMVFYTQSLFVAISV